MVSIIRDTINILGVSHIKPNIGRVISTLRRISITEETLVFIEPKKNILTGIEKCNIRSIELFFNEILAYLMSKKVKIIPLNPRYLPSHNSTLLFEKYAKQLAEEEYMANIIKSTPGKDKLIIIGDIHAKRLSHLIYNPDSKINYIRAAPKTPDDLISHSWRNALEGISNEIISINWLNRINNDIRYEMGLPKDANIHESCWNDTYLYSLYLKKASRLIKRHNGVKFKINMGKETRLLADELKEKSAKLLEKYHSNEDHPIISFPYTNFNLSS